MLQENSQFLSDAAREEMPQVGQILAEQYSKLSSWGACYGTQDVENDA